MVSCTRSNEADYWEFRSFFYSLAKRKVKEASRKEKLKAVKRREEEAERKEKRERGRSLDQQRSIYHPSQTPSVLLLCSMPITSLMDRWSSWDFVAMSGVAGEQRRRERREGKRNECHHYVLQCLSYSLYVIDSVV